MVTQFRRNGTGVESGEMNRFVWLALALTVLLCLPLGAASNQKLIVVTGPTVIAFFPPVTPAELNKDADTNEALADFQLYAAHVRPKLDADGIHFEEIYASSFAVRLGTKTTNFRPQKTHIGYYFIAPGKSPRVEYGVMTDSDILEAATDYFHTAAK
jgi:hypothetical protein